MLLGILLDILKTCDEILALLRPGPPILRGVRGVGEEVSKVFCPVVWLLGIETRQTPPVIEVKFQKTSIKRSAIQNLSLFST
jgi:hypothetical protein